MQQGDLASPIANGADLWIRRADCDGNYWGGLGGERGREDGARGVRGHGNRKGCVQGGDLRLGRRIAIVTTMPYTGGLVLGTLKF